MSDGDELKDEGFRELFGEDSRPPCQLYLISPPMFELALHAQALKRALAAGGAIAAYQLRLKIVDDGEILRAAEALMPICADADVAFILNDRMDLAKRCGADGVHLGQGDGSAVEARALLGKEAQIGVTCHASRHLAMEAGEAGANYVAFGSFFPTETKVVEHIADPAILSWWTALSPIPCVAIGGITPGNCRPLVEAGADFLATSGAVWGGDPEANVRAFAEAMAGRQDAP
ncbi:thiamine phosphate synthase [Sandaracinobacteroides hominis]|uniref:thiamine phosphate synthase n=1 Tax=Sandaracinobacteroides hominis TaxID=2780086 RepID=UPI0018F6907C|nr:thiamine phosphate synthase [Sandaracinobacteroides hominis]